MNRRPTLARQRGAVLITTSILLIVLTILALAAVSMNSTQTRVAANSADNLIAYQAAEAALSKAQTDLINGIYAPAAFANNANGLYVLDTSSQPPWSANLTTATWWSDSTHALQLSAQVTTFPFTGSSSAAYVIEKLPSVLAAGQSSSAQVQVFRVTARALGPSGRSPVVLQATVQVS